MTSSGIEPVTFWLMAQWCSKGTVTRIKAEYHKILQYIIHSWLQYQEYK